MDRDQQRECVISFLENTPVAVASLVQNWGCHPAGLVGPPPIVFIRMSDALNAECRELRVAESHHGNGAWHFWMDMWQEYEAGLHILRNGAKTATGFAKIHDQRFKRLFDLFGFVGGPEPAAASKDTSRPPPRVSVRVPRKRSTKRIVFRVGRRDVCVDIAIRVGTKKRKH
jgi:hypothetical protein